MPTPPPASQIEFWNGAPGLRWAKEQARLDRVFEPIDVVGLEVAAAAKGEHVVDLGCGAGASTLQLGARVGPSGSVLGVDPSAPMLGRAKERAKDTPWISFALADASRFPFPGTADLLYSRFGSMFFEDPLAAFAHLSSALRPKGRIVLVVWRTRAENPWFMLPLEAAAKHLPPEEPTPPNAPGPFSFASEARVREVLSGAGFVDVKLAARDVLVSLSETGVDAAVDFAVEAGPASRAFAGADDALASRMRASIQEALAPYLEGSRVALWAGVWIVTAARQ